VSDVTLKPRICAHAGCEGLPMDGLDAIEAGIQAGADFVELDLRFTRDGLAVLGHDPVVSRAPAGLTTLDLLARHPGVVVNIDVKELSALVRHPTRLTKGSVPNPTYYTGLKSHQLATFRRGCPGAAHTVDNLPWWFGFGSTEARVAHLKRLKGAGVLALNLSYLLVDERLMDASRRAGLPVRVWTVDDKQNMARMAALGVEVITTNRVTELRKVLA